MLQKTLDLVREHTGNDLPHYTDCVFFNQAAGPYLTREI